VLGWSPMGRQQYTLGQPERTTARVVNNLAIANLDWIGSALTWRVVQGGLLPEPDSRSNTPRTCDTLSTTRKDAVRP